MKTTEPGWSWQYLGGQWHLVRQDPRRTVVLTAGDLTPDESTTTCGLVVRDETGRLVPLTPDHPAARLIAAAPDLLEVLEDVLRETPGGNIRRALAEKANAALARVRGGTDCSD